MHGAGLCGGMVAGVQVKDPLSSRGWLVADPAARERLLGPAPLGTAGGVSCPGLQETSHFPC